MPIGQVHDENYCAAMCAAVQGCNLAVYSPSTSNCWLKTSSTGTTVANSDRISLWIGGAQPVQNPSCSVWDGTPLKAGNLIALQSTVVKNYMTYNTAALFVVPAVYGNNPYNMYTFMASSNSPAPTWDTLFIIMALSTSTSYGPDVTLKHYKTNATMSVDCGVEGYETQQYEISKSSCKSTSFRLASQARAWTDPNCGNCAGTYTVSAPQVVPQYEGGDGMYSCSQTYDDYNQMLPWQCWDYYVSFGGYGGESNRQLSILLETYTLWTCTTGTSVVKEEKVEVRNQGVSVGAGVGIGIGVVVGVAALVGLVVGVAWKFGKNEAKDLSEPLQI